MFGKISQQGGAHRMAPPISPPLGLKTKPIKKAPHPKPTRQGSCELEASKFRMLNEILYTSSSSEALKYFESNQEDYKMYHDGYRFQAEKWEAKPLQSIISYFTTHKQFYANSMIADLGCGEGLLAKALLSKGYKLANILSYDLVAIEPFIKVVDIAHLPLEAETVDVCVFCLSLMGTNYIEFIMEAARVLKPSGELIIAEVESRSPDWDVFIKLVSSLGFQLINDGVRLEREKVTEKLYFRAMHFRREDNNKRRYGYFKGQKYDLKELSQQLLLSCLYKRR